MQTENTQTTESETTHSAPFVWEDMPVDGLDYPIRCSPGAGQLPLELALSDLLARLPEHARGHNAHPGLALHAALCAAAGVRPETHGIYSAMARAIDEGRVSYQNKLLDRFTPLKAVRAICQRLGLVLSCLPDGTYEIKGQRA